MTALSDIAPVPLTPHTTTLHREEEGGYAAEWLEAVAVGAMQTYVERILEIPKLTQHGARQLVKDMGKSLLLTSYCAVTNSKIYRR